MNENEKQAIVEMAKIAFPFLKEVEEEHLNTAIFGNIHIAQPILNLYKQGYRKQEWRSVDDGLPENDWGKHWKERSHYLVMTEPSGLMRVARFGSKEFPWWIDSHDTVMTSSNYAKVTHWMPLPQPPKGGAER